MELGLKLLKLQEEYANREVLSEFHGDRVGRSRSVEAIAADYETTLRDLLTR